jgi:hypothetical protein
MNKSKKKPRMADMRRSAKLARSDLKLFEAGESGLLAARASCMSFVMLADIALGIRGDEDLYDDGEPEESEAAK